MFKAGSLVYVRDKEYRSREQGLGGKNFRIVGDETSRLPFLVSAQPASQGRNKIWCVDGSFLFSRNSPTTASDMPRIHFATESSPRSSKKIPIKKNRSALGANTNFFFR